MVSDSLQSIRQKHVSRLSQSSSAIKVFTNVGSGFYFSVLTEIDLACEIVKKLGLRWNIGPSSAKLDNVLKDDKDEYRRLVHYVSCAVFQDKSFHFVYERRFQQFALQFCHTCPYSKSEKLMQS